jgi:hypothetical protein
MMRHVPLVALLLLLAGAAVGAERLADPTQAFVQGYDPSGNDFLANTPERTVLLRIRADLDGDGHDDLALSDSATWGNAGGQWLLFRGEAVGGYTYWGTLFFAPGAAALRAPAPGGGELTIYVRTSVSRGTLATYRLTPAGITRARSQALDLEQPREHERYESALKAGVRLPVESCRLLDYRRDPGGCWRPGPGRR